MKWLASTILKIRWRFRRRDNRDLREVINQDPKINNDQLWVFRKEELKEIHKKINRSLKELNPKHDMTDAELYEWARYIEEQFPYVDAKKGELPNNALHLTDEMFDTMFNTSVSYEEYLKPIFMHTLKCPLCKLVYDTKVIKKWPDSRLDP